MSSYSIPLFPLSTVIFPEGVLTLKVYETRYLDMVRECLRNKTPFGVVALYPDNHVNLNINSSFKSEFPFANVGTVFTIEEADVSCLGLINIKCSGQKTFNIVSAAQAQDGLWIAEVTDVKKEIKMEIPSDLESTKTHLQHIIESLKDKDITELDLPISKPYQLNDCAWVANRWCEILNMPLMQKQRMLELDSPLIRLELIQDMLSKEFSNES
jgi:Lon protease-like protein